MPEIVSPVLQTSFSGRGQDVSPYFMLPPTVSSISVNTSSTTLRAWLYQLDDLGGSAVQAGINVYDGRIFDFTFPGNQSSYPLELTVPVDDNGTPQNSGPYVLAVSNTLANGDAWTISFA